jgi:hypothetical protein
VLDRVERTPAGREGQVYDNEAGKRLFDKINCRQSRPGHGGRRGAASEDSEVAAGNEEEKEKMRWGVGASL